MKGERRMDCIPSDRVLLDRRNFFVALTRAVRMGRLLAFAILVLALGACAGRPVVGPMVLDDSREAVFVFRIDPSQFNVIVFNGEVEQGAFKFSQFTPARFTGAPQDGYIIGKAKAGEWVAINTIGGRTACGGGQTVAFSLPAGQVGYVGDFKYDIVGGRMKLTASGNLAAASDFVATHHPELSNRLVQAGYKTVTVGDKCPYRPGEN